MSKSPMIKINLKNTLLASALLATAVMSTSALATQEQASQCSGEMVTRSVSLKVEKQYRLTDASLTLCQVAKSELNELKGFVKALNNNDAASSRRYFNPTHATSDFTKLRSSYAPVFKHKDRLVVNNAYQFGQQVVLFFGLENDSTYSNYFTFERVAGLWRYASADKQRSGLAFLLARSVNLKGKQALNDMSLTLKTNTDAQDPAATLHLNGSSCVLDGCVDSPQMQTINQIKQLIEQQKYRQLPNHFAGASAKKLNDWLKPMPDEDKAKVMEQYFLPQNIIYRYDFGQIALLGFVKTQGEFERFNKGLTTDVYPQHIYFVKHGNDYKVANFYQENLIDEYLKQQLMLPFLEAK